jgi:hypothetical protein
MLGLAKNLVKSISQKSRLIIFVSPSISWHTSSLLMGKCLLNDGQYLFNKYGKVSSISSLHNVALIIRIIAQERTPFSPRKI